MASHQPHGMATTIKSERKIDCPENLAALLDDLATHHLCAKEAKNTPDTRSCSQIYAVVPPGPSTNRSMLKISNASCLKTPPKPDLVPKFAIFMNKAGLGFLYQRPQCTTVAPQDVLGRDLSQYWHAFSGSI